MSNEGEILTVLLHCTVWRGLPGLWVSVCVTLMWVSPTATWLGYASATLNFPSYLVLMLSRESWWIHLLAPTTCASALFELFWLCNVWRSSVYPIFTDTSAKTMWPRPPWARPSRRGAASDWSPRKPSSPRGSHWRQRNHLLQRGSWRVDVLGS